MDNWSNSAAVRDLHDSGLSVIGNCITSNVCSVHPMLILSTVHLCCTSTLYMVTRACALYSYSSVWYWRLHREIDFGFGSRCACHARRARGRARRGEVASESECGDFPHRPWWTGAQCSAGAWPVPSARCPEPGVRRAAGARWEAGAQCAAGARCPVPGAGARCSAGVAPVKKIASLGRGMRSRWGLVAKTWNWI